MSKHPPIAPSASAVGPCPTRIKIGRMPWHWMMMMILCLTTRQPTGSFASIRLCFTIENVKYISIVRLKGCAIL